MRDKSGSGAAGQGHDGGTSEAWWKESSFDLQRGLDVEHDGTVPASLSDVLCGSPTATPPAPRATFTVVAVNRARRQAAIVEHGSKAALIEWFAGCRPEEGDTLSGLLKESRIVRMFNLTRDCTIDAVVQATGMDPGAVHALLV
ncbi:MAG: hypothetical protein ACM3N6_15335 [Betaproteobacteria bacterium]